MNRTQDEIAARALRLLGVVAADESLTADQANNALAVLEGIWSELVTEAQPTWDIVTGTPPEGFIPLANWLAAEMAPEYGVAPPMMRGRAKLRLLAVVRPDDRDPDSKCDPEADYGCGARVVEIGGPIPLSTWNDEGTW